MTSFSPAFLEDLRSRINLSDVVGRRVQWDRRKTNPARRDYWACCPFHSERSPSFHVDDSRGFYKCFGCGQKGDAITFLVESERLSFRDAVAELAAMAGIPLPDETPDSLARDSRFDRLRAACEAAATWFQSQLPAPAGSAARAYLLRRGVHADSLAAFRVGYAPGERRGLISQLEKLGFEGDVIVEAGLAIRPDDGGPAYDRFRDRIIFPIADTKGRPIAFGGRAMAADAQAKYLNSPETPLFHKGSILYNLAQARRPAIETARIVVAEGYMDVIALHEGGIQAAVAPLGTALTEDQMGSLWKICPEPILCFDGDKAGRGAAHRAMERGLPLLKPGRSLRFALLPEGKDPDDLMRSEGPAAVEQVLAKAQSLADLLWQNETEGGIPATPERKAALEARLKDAIRRIEDAAVRSHYQQEFKARLQQLFATPTENGRSRTTRPVLRGQRGGFGRFSPSGATGALLQNGLAQNGDPPSIDLILAVLVSHPDLLVAQIELLVHLEPIALWRKRLKEALIAAAGIDHLDSAGMKDHLNAKGLGRDISELDRRVRANPDWASLVTGTDLSALQGRLESAFRAAEAGFASTERVLKDERYGSW